MKKIAIILAAVLYLGVTSNSYAASVWLARTAAGSVVLTNTGTRPALSLRPSANVFFSWEVEASGTAYSIGTTHSSGTMTYATSSGDTNIYRWLNEGTQVPVLASDGLSITGPQVSPAAPTGANAAATWEAGWTASK